MEPETLFSKSLREHEEALDKQFNLLYKARELDAQFTPIFASHPDLTKHFRRTFLLHGDLVFYLNHGTPDEVMHEIAKVLDIDRPDVMVGEVARSIYSHDKHIMILSPHKE